MGRRRWRSAVALLLVWVPLRLLAATRYGDVTVSLEVLPGDNPTHGYRAIIANIANEDTRSAHKVELILDSEMAGYMGLASVSRAVEVAAGSEIRVQLWLPAGVTWSFTECEVRIDGASQRATLPVNARNVSVGARYAPAMYGPPAGFQCFVGQRVSRDTVENWFQSANQRLAAAGRASAPPMLMRSEREIQAWPTRWLAYSSYDAVMVTDREWSLAPEQVRDALWRYAECGGTLVVTGLFEPPVTCRVLAGAVKGRLEDAPFTEYEVSLGRCYVFRSPAYANVATGVSRLTAHLAAAYTEVWQNQADAQRAHAIASVVEEVAVPFGLCLGVLTVFAIAAGPVSLTILRRKNRGIWIFWIAPALGLVTSGLVIVSVLLGEGITPSARLDGFTILDERVGRATTVGVNGFYCPLRLRGGLSYSYDTEVTACRVNGLNNTGDVTGRELVWDDNQLLTGKWVRPRVPQYFRVRTSELRKERLGLVRDGKNLAVVNGLGADIERLVLVLPNGKIFDVSNVPKGAQVDAGAPAEVVLPEQLRQLSEVVLAREEWQEARKESLIWSGILRPGTYLAYLSEAPFVANGLQQSADVTESSIVFGILREEEGE